MNRTGLTIALAIAAVVGLLFGLFPQLDLELAALFYDPARGTFLSRSQSWIPVIRDLSMWVIFLFFIPMTVALVAKLIWPRRKSLVSFSGAVFMLATMALGPGLVVNAGLKDFWNRARPIDVQQFGGQGRFTAWWDPRGTCTKNCSFVTGDGSGAFWTLAPAALAPPAWRAAAYAAALAFGSGVGLLRMAAGGHFFTDVVFAGVFVFLIIWLVHGLMFRWPRTRLDEAVVDKSVERLGLALHRLFGRRP